MKTEEELYIFFENSLKNKLLPLEEYRLKKISKLQRLLIYVAVSLFISVFGILSKFPFFIFVFCIPLLYCLGLVLKNLFEMNDHLQKEFKNKIMMQLLSFLFGDYQYIPRQKIARSVLEKSMLFRSSIARIEGEDFMQFKIDEALIMLCEAKVINSRDRVQFRGIFMSASFNKEFNSKTFVFSNKASNVTNILKKEIIGHFKKVKLEDPEFEKEFIVLTSDQIEARYILTPSLMQRIMTYKRKTKKNFALSFVSNRLYCAIPNFINLFEPALFEPFDFNFIKRNYLSIKVHTDIIEDLNLNLRIWSKQ